MRRARGRTTRRVVIKAEVVRLAGAHAARQSTVRHHETPESPRFVYEQVYCARGDMENRIKELHDGLQIGRTSCCRFWANQLRVLLTAAAYVLMQELRLRAARTACARAQVSGLRDRLLKLGVHVVVSVAGSCCTCRRPRPTSIRGAGSPSPWAPERGNPDRLRRRLPRVTLVRAELSAASASPSHRGPPQPADLPFSLSPHRLAPV